MLTPPLSHLSIVDYAHEGFAVGKIDSRVVFTRFAIPGENVEAHITSENTKFSHAVATHIHDASPWRVPYAWKEAGPNGVGGADLQHVDFAHQYEWKTHVLRGVLTRIAGTAFTEHLTQQGITPTIKRVGESVDGWHQRTRASAVINSEKKLSMYEDFSHNLRAITSLPHLVEEAETLDIFSPAWTRAAREGEKITILAPSASDPIVLIGSQAYINPATYAKSHYVEEDVWVGNTLLHYRVKANGFWQIHPLAPTTLISALIKAITAQGYHPRTIAELYSGAGLFTSALAQFIPDSHIESYEANRFAVEDARANTRDYPHVHTHTRRLDDRFFTSLTSHTPSFDTIVLDPPRKGIGVKAARALANCSVQKIVYIACDPASLARDCAILFEAGWTVESFEGFDLFPHTHHMESVISLVRQ